MSQDLFIGLVTYKGSRFSDARTDSGLASSLARSLHQNPAFTGRVFVEVFDQDLFDGELVPLTRAEVVNSIRAELRIESRWRRYLNPMRKQYFSRMLMPVRHVYRYLKFAPPWVRTLNLDSPGAVMLRRLVNIELAHISLLESAVDSVADWILILEDDADTRSVEEFGRALSEFLGDSYNSNNLTRLKPKYINMSQSFTLSKVGSAGSDSNIGFWGNSSRIFSTSIPFTNTVCAVMYSREFAKVLLDRFRQIPLSPVIPIDWKLNLAIMQLFHEGILGEGDCWTIDPAPILQRSMHHGQIDRLSK